ncbi:hypothetical protein EV383_2356 [Pseudonocardia sediminis]|uniref:Uncharacterized protein n=1 Tax=Pseudonocardia sediminis TaxID=1397368 RepID=A0A4Q7UZ58_PSEST|nr:hypothetical protein [Pseudonocardia sediminis]RZT85489.1 hypothetical protein EV383_2356 [Pseudonocardia sediminis]
MTRPATTPPTVARRRPPVPVVVVAVIVVVLTGFGCFGLVYFGLFVSPDVNPAVGSPAAVAFAAVGLVLTITAAASLPGLWRGRRGAWHVLTCLVTAQLYFGSYKLLVEGETDSAIFMVANLVVGVLLLLPATRRHVSA